MNQVIERIYDEAHSVWRFRWLALATASALALAGWLTVFTLADRYEASASIFVDTRTALQPALQGASIGQEVDAQLNYVQRSLLAGDQLVEIARKAGVLPVSVTDPTEQAFILRGLADAVKVKAESAGTPDSDRKTSGTVYSIAYQDSNRAKALKVVDVVLTTLQEETLGGKREGAEGAQRFLSKQIAELDKQLDETDGKLAQFKQRNIGLLPSENGGYFNQVTTEEDSAKKVQSDLSIAISRRAELARQLRGESVINAAGAGPVVTASGVTGGADTVSRINSTKAQIDELLQRYTDRHPDVLSARESLAALERQREVEIASLRRGDSAAIAASGAANNPVYQSIQLALNQADLEIATLRRQLGLHLEKARELRTRMGVAPQVEAELAQLTRDYKTLEEQRSKLVENLQKARVGEQADTAGSVRFEVVQPPTANFAPVFPRRGLFLAGALVLALAVGGGLAYLMHLLRPVVGSEKALVALTGVPVLGVVSGAFPGQSASEARGDLMRFVMGAAGLLLCFVVVVALNWAGLRLFTSPAG